MSTGIPSIRSPLRATSLLQQKQSHEVHVKGRPAPACLVRDSGGIVIESCGSYLSYGSSSARTRISRTNRGARKKKCPASSALGDTHGAAAAAAAAAVVVPAGGSGMQGMAEVIGWLVIAGSCVRSLPQIVRIIKNKSVEGLSLLSFAAELAVYTVSVVYNVFFSYPFSTYGDLVMCWFQNILIILLMFVHGTISKPVKIMVSLGFIGLTVFLLSGSCSPSTLQALQASSVVVLALGGRVPQIVMNIQRGNSGELSILSTGLSLLGNFARVITTMVLVKDVLILSSSISQAVLNAILLWQCLQTRWRAQNKLQFQSSAL